MTIFHNKNKGAAALITAALLTAILFTACPNTAGGKPAGGGSGGGGTVPPTPGPYVQVLYTNLETYLATTASSEKLNYIKVTGTIPPEAFAGSSSNPGDLGKKLKNHSGKKVALKIKTYPAGLTDMRYCFFGCESLITVPAIPASVTDMGGCFLACTSLTTAPAIPESVTVMEYCFYDCTKLTGVTLKCNYNADYFDDAFTNCDALQNGSIKVPAAYYNDYTTDTALTAMNVPGDTVVEQRAKFAKIAP